MTETNINQTIASEDAHTDFSVASMSTDAAGEQKETTWINSKWGDYFGYYKTIPELKRAIDAKATWTIGKGINATVSTKLHLKTIRGWGRDTFDTILENAIRTYQIGGDFFAEIIRNKKKEFINLKPLDPATIKIVVNQKGFIIRYEQVSKTKTPNKKIKIEEMFHLARNRVADEIHGQSLIEELEVIILMRNEAMGDYQRVLHRNIDPMMIFHLDTDDETKIANFKTKMDAARGKGENMYIPKDAVVPEQLSLAPNATLNPLPWIESLNKQFYEACGTPQIIVGGSGEFTEASAKIAYLAFQQTIEEEQLFIEEQVGIQLGITINLEFPASLENELLSDKAKDGATKIKPNETTAGSGQ